MSLAGSEETKEAERNLKDDWINVLVTNNRIQWNINNRLGVTSYMG